MAASNCLFATLATALVALTAAPASASDEVFPEKPEPAVFVNDFAQVFTDAARKSQLEDSLARFAYHSSTQVVVVTVASLEGYDQADYAQRLAQKWGIGSAEHNNGALLLVKPKTDLEKGQAFIAVGYGLEGELTDLLCSRIVNDEMIPYFKYGDYAGGIEAGAVAVMLAVNGLYAAPPEEGLTWFEILFLVIVIALILLGIFGSSGGGSTIPASVYWGTRGSSSNWGAFSGGSGSFRGGGYGGYGGSFGGGSFGGGGGGGSW